MQATNSKLQPSVMKKMRRHLPGTGLANKKVLILCSGGIDSVALVSLVATLPKKAAPSSIDVLYLDHNFRTDSKDERDAAAKIAKQYSVVFHEVKREDSKTPTNQNKQDMARQWRYATAVNLAHDLGCDTVLTAHHADDQLENVLMNLLGVFDGNQAAMDICRPLADDLTLMRPMLGVSRKDIVEYVHDMALVWGEDSSNKELDYTRNKLRNVAIPLLQEIAPSGAGKLVHAAQNLNTNNRAMRELANALIQSFDMPVDELPLDKLNELSSDTQKEVIAAWLKMNLPDARSFNRKHVENVIALLAAKHDAMAKLPASSVQKTRTTLQLIKA